MILGLIPARAGSQRIENKNLINGPLFRGAVLISHTIEAALGSRLDKVVVSTNDYPTFHNISSDVDVRLREDHISGPDSPTEDTIAAIMDEYNPDICVLLQLTSPLRTAQHIDEAIELLLDRQVDSVVSVSPFHGFTWREVGDTAVGSYDPHHRPMSQKQEIWKENGAIYVFTRRLWETSRTRVGGKVALYHMDDSNGIEIDSPMDIALAETAAAFVEGNVSSVRR